LYRFDGNTSGLYDSVGLKTTDRPAPPEFASRFFSNPDCEFKDCGDAISILASGPTRTISFNALLEVLGLGR